MKKLKKLILPGAIILAIGIPIYRWTTSFSRFGSLTPDTSRSISDKKNISDSLIKGKIQADEIKSAIFIKFPKEEVMTSEWRYHFPGFMKTELDVEEIQAVLASLQPSKTLILPYPTKVTVENGRAIEHGGPTAKQRELRDDLTGFARNADNAYQSGEFQFYLKNGKIGALTVWWYKDAVALHSGWCGDPYVEGYCYTREIWTMIPKLIARLKPSEVGILFPEVDSKEALRKAESKFGEVYRQAQDFMAKSDVLTKAVGNVREIRPALGPNWSNWMLENTFDFSFRVIGQNGIAAVKISGMRMGGWKLKGEMVLNGDVREI